MKCRALSRFLLPGLMLFLIPACVPKKGGELPIPSAQNEPSDPTPPIAQHQPEPPPPQPEDIESEPPASREPTPSLAELPPLPEDPRDMLEAAFEFCRLSSEHWKAGELDEALDNLDLAYDAILQIDLNEDDDPDLLQEKADLRYLISKRIVEIHASERTVVGDLNKSIPLVMNQFVEREIKSFQGRERKFFLESYQRAGRYRPMILEKLAQADMPEQLAWLPLIESGFKTSAYSRARALGLWQFIPSTGYRYDLNRDQWMDERMDPEKSTRAAIAYLTDLHNLFGDWMTALAAYNCGEGRVSRVIKSQRVNYLDDFWDLYTRLPSETARYVPRMLATLAIIENPEKYGFDLPPMDAAHEYETLTVDRAVRLSDLDNLGGFEPGTLKALNAELRHGATPARSYQLNVPVGSAPKLTAGVAALPLFKDATAVAGVHVIRRGETLSTIARKYRTSVSKIVRLNGMKNQHRIWPGQKLKIPGRWSPNTTARVAAAQTTGGQVIWKEHRVRQGDSLWRIARHYNTTVNLIRQWNNLSSNHLKLNQRLRIQTVQGGVKTADNHPRKGKTYEVRRGDTLAKIAKRHGVRLSSLLSVNNLTKRSKIYPNQILVLP